MNRPAIEERIERLAADLLVAGGFDGFMRHVRALRADLNVPNTLNDLGVPRTDFGRICEMALSDPTAAGNPVPLTRELAERMLAAAFGD